jgi:hypothetical protein
MTTKMLRTTFLAGLLLATVCLLGGTLSQAGKKPGGGGGGGAVPAGRIYFQVNSIVSNSGPGPDTLEEFSGNWSMLADGSNKTLVPNYPYAGEPNRNRSNNGNWLLSVEAVAGTYPNGRSRQELFATFETSDPSNPLKIPLTNDPYVMPWSAIRWAHDDSFVSFAAVTWTAVASGGNFTDDAGQQWLAEADVLVAPVGWSTGLPDAEIPVAVLPVGLNGTTSEGFWDPEVVALDWSPAGDELVIEIEQDLSGSRSLCVVSFDAMGVMTDIVPLGPGRQPEWSPNGLKIAYSAPNGDLAPNNVIWTVNPNGTGLFQVTSSAQNYDFDPHWSPDSAHLAFTRLKQSNQKASTSYLKNVMRVPATGGSPVDLTKDLADDAYAAYARAWR